MMQGPGAQGSVAALGRRTFMQGLAGGLLAVLGLRTGAARGSAGPLYVGCRADDAGGYRASGFRVGGDLLFDLPLPGKGHGAAFRPGSPECVVFARRPGTFAVVIDVDEGVALRRFDAATGRHFYGHGAFSPMAGTCSPARTSSNRGRG
jgi:hypothetical protein